MTQHGSAHGARAAGASLLVLSVMLVTAGGRAQESGSGAVRPAPRLPDGRISLSGPPGEVGNWQGGTRLGGKLFFANRAEALDPESTALPTNLVIDEVPFQPWARALFDYRQATFLKDEPHTRCRPSGAARLVQTPYGFEILDLPDAGEVIIVGVGGPHSWKVVRMDERTHPDELVPTAYGHSIGHWEGDTLVIDTVGYSETFWMSRLGVPHTHRLHTIERISRPDFHRLRYELTIDDPGAYTETWSGGWHLDWIAGNEPFDYLCQENNLDAARMVGPDHE